MISSVCPISKLVEVIFVRTSYFFCLRAKQVEASHLRWPQSKEKSVDLGLVTLPLCKYSGDLKLKTTYREVHLRGCVFCRWNFTPSPGWTKEEAQILKLCLMKFGVGRWTQILETGLLPGKLIQQLNGQTQRLLGQQSLAGDFPPFCLHCPRSGVVKSVCVL